MDMALTTDQRNDSSEVWIDETLSLTVSYSNMGWDELPTGVWAMYVWLHHLRKCLYFPAF